MYKVQQNTLEVIFRIIYGFIEISELDVILNTWSITDIPPNPSKNAEITTFTESTLNGILAIIDTPFVSSIIPENKPVANSWGRPKASSAGATIRLSKSNTFVLFNIDIITLNSTTNPPIITTVLIELIMLFWRIPPKLFNVGGIFLFAKEDEYL